LALSFSLLSLSPFFSSECSFIWPQWTYVASFYPYFSFLFNSLETHHQLYPTRNTPVLTQSYIWFNF
jgi:hypothetical protein